MIQMKPCAIRVHTLSGASRRGVVRLGSALLACALGKGGCKAIKREGDGATPLGSWRVRAVLYRPDRWRPQSGVTVSPIRRDDGWCDAPDDRNYNRRIRHPYPASAEHLWRADRLYDIVVVLGHNDRPRRRGMGSAIFMHLAREGYSPTEGCIALKERDLRRIVAHLRPGSYVHIG